VSTCIIEDVGENLLDKEIELMRRMMMKVSWKKPAAVKQKESSKRKTTEDCESLFSGARQHKVWRPGEQQQTKVVTNGRWKHKIWNLGKHRFEHMMQEHSTQGKLL